MYVVARALSLWILGVVLRGLRAVPGQGEHVATVMPGGAIAFDQIDIHQPIRLLVRLLVSETIQMGMHDGHVRGEWQYASVCDYAPGKANRSSFGSIVGGCEVGRWIR